MQAPKEIIQNKYLQHLTTAHWTCSTAAAVGVGHDHENNLYIYILHIYIYIYIYHIYIHSSILQLRSLLFEHFVELCSCYLFFSVSRF